MIFNRKKKAPDMVDLRQLQKRGVVRIPKSDIKVPTNSDGFVELNQAKTEEEKTTSQDNANFFGFMPTPSTEEPKEQFSSSPEGYNKREVDTKITNLDNKIYKLEQRIELLEKKLDVNQPSQKVGPMGW